MCDLGADAVYFGFNNKIVLDSELKVKSMVKRLFKKLNIIILALMVVSVGAVSCGKKGPLYLPKVKAATEQKPETTPEKNKTNKKTDDEKPVESEK